VTAPDARAPDAEGPRDAQPPPDAQPPADAGPTDAGPHDAYDRLRRRLLWRLPMGLYLLGSRAGDRRNLMTINWVMQVSVKPKQLAVSVEASAVTHQLLVEGGCFSVSLIRREDKAVVRRFVKPAIDDPGSRTLSGMAYREALTGAPIPEIAVAWLDCEVRGQVSVGSHTLFVGEVVDVGAIEEEEDTPVLRMEDTRMSYGG
jgi:flavin reductase (DIM6/NTAB) family NADH-FMN oxidoreductase RutF